MMPSRSSHLMATSRSPKETQTSPSTSSRNGDVTAEELHVQCSMPAVSEQRCDAVSCMLRYAQWEDIWDYVSRDEVRDLFEDLDLPDSLRAAWARMLKIETVAT